MNFYEFYNLLNENTISQELKKMSKQNWQVFDKINKKVIEWTKNYFYGSELNDKAIEVFAKWVFFRMEKRLSIFGGKPDAHLSAAPSTISTNTLVFLNIEFDKIVAGTHGLYDFLIASVQNNKWNPQLASKFNNPEFDESDLRSLSIQYHEDLKKKRRNMPGRVGENILSFPDGYSWIDLKRGSCDVESITMGHCGNKGAKLGDTILSLRDKKNIPHLTFILNRGVLGEMKGRSNDKPASKYHPYIIELLKLPIIKRIKGEGYLPENNFKLSDLNNDQLSDLIKFKPEIENDFIIEKIKDNKHNIESVLNKEQILKFLNSENNDEESKLAKAILAFYHKDPEILTALTDTKTRKPSVGLLLNVIRNVNTPKEVLIKLADHENHHVREGLARNSRDIEILNKLANDVSPDVRVEVAVNPFIGASLLSLNVKFSKPAKEILEKLANDEVGYVSNRAKSALNGQLLYNKVEIPE